MDENKKNEFLDEETSEENVSIDEQKNEDSVEDRASKILSGLKESALPDAVQDWDGVLPENKDEFEIIEEETHIIDEIKEEEDIEDIPEEELCVLCGKRRRCTSISEDYEYCAQCRIKMLKRPLNGMGIAAFVLVFLVFLGVSFIGLVPNAGFFSSIAVGGQTLVGYLVEKNGELENAVELYDEALLYAETFDLGTSMSLIRRAALVTERNEGPDKAKAIITSTVGTEVAKNDPELAKLLDRQEKFATTSTACANVISPYYDQMEGTMDIKKAIAALDKLADTNKGEYDNDIITYFKSVVAVFEYDTEMEIKYREEVRKDAPEKYWLYNDGNALIDAYMRTGEYDKAMGVADDILKYNKTSSDANWSKAQYALIKGNKAEAEKIADSLDKTATTKATSISIKALIARLDGDYDKAIELCTEAVDSDTYNSEIYYQNMVAMILSNKTETAYSMISEYGTYVQTNGTQSDYTKFIYLYVLASYLEDKETYKEIEADFQSEGATLAFPEEFEKYKAKEISLEEIFLKGDFELR